MATRRQILEALGQVVNHDTTYRDAINAIGADADRLTNYERIYDSLTTLYTEIYNQANAGNSFDVDDPSLNALLAKINPVIAGAAAYFLMPNSTKEQGNTLRDAFKALNTFRGVAPVPKQKAPVPPPIVTFTEPTPLPTQPKSLHLSQADVDKIVDKRSRTDQIATANAMTILKRISEIILNEKVIGMEGVLRLSGTDSVANQKFGQYQPKSLITAKNPQSVIEWDASPNPSDVISTMKRFFNPSNTMKTKTPMVGLALGKDISGEFIASGNPLKFLCEQLPASHLAILKIAIEMMQQVSAQSATNKMTASNCAISANGLLSTITGLGDDVDASAQMQVMQTLNTAAASWIENGKVTLDTLDTAIAAKHEAGDVSDRDYGSYPDKYQLNLASPADEFEIIERPSRTPSPTAATQVSRVGAKFASLGQKAGEIASRLLSASIITADSAASGSVSPPQSPHQNPIEPSFVRASSPTLGKVGVPDLESVGALKLALGKLIDERKAFIAEQLSRYTKGTVFYRQWETIKNEFDAVEKSANVDVHFGDALKLMSNPDRLTKEAGMSYLNASLKSMETMTEQMYQLSALNDTTKTLQGVKEYDAAVGKYFEAKEAMQHSAKAELQTYGKVNPPSPSRGSPSKLK